MAHVLVFPFPAQGHVPIMLSLSELLTRAGVFVTFLNTEHVHERFAGSSPDFDRLPLLPNFRFRTISDGLPKDEPRNMLKFLELMQSIAATSKQRYMDLLVAKDGTDPDGWPPVTCVVSCDMLAFALDIAEEAGVPAMLLRTSSTCSGWISCSLSKLLENGELPFPEGADLDELLQGVEGMESFLRRRDLNVMYRQIKSADDPILRYMSSARDRFVRGNAVIVNTIECLESSVLSQVSSINPNIYGVGPLQNLLQNFGPANPDGVESTPPKGVCLWEEDRSCLAWLDSQPSKSVVYVSFGSITVVSRETLVEFWHGLVDSGHRFLWVIRPDMVKVGEAVPEELAAATRERGRIVAWAPQVEVLAHAAVGCFLTHSGWNSTMESIVAGVPMICWPFFADQHTNSRFVSAVWKVGVDMKDLSGRRAVEEMVRKVMEGEEAEEFRRRASKLSIEARRATEQGGSSYTNFQKLVEHIKSLSNGSSK